MKRNSVLPHTQTEVVPLVKTSITMPRVLMQFAETQLTAEGFNSLSAYLSELVRRDRRETLNSPTVHPENGAHDQAAKAKKSREKPSGPQD